MVMNGREPGAAIVAGPPDPTPRPAGRSSEHLLDRNSLRDALATLASSHVWTWTIELRDLFDRLAGSPTHPAVTVAALDDDRLDELLADDDVVDVVQRSIDALTAAREASGQPEIAYFSPEFGISELVPQYSGGLGILAGDHVKASNDLAVPLVGVGLFYREGFFRQDIADGHQVERYERYEPEQFGAIEAPTAVDVPIADRDVTARIWLMSVGRVQLILLDTDHPDNAPEDRRITDRLYSGDRRHRIEQELVLGVGGVRALEALGLVPTCVPPQRGSCRVPDPGVARSPHRRRCTARRGCTRGSSATRVHHPHSGPGRHRSVLQRHLVGAPAAVG